MAWSLASWFLALVLLNVLDIATTMPVYESNPFTLYLWGRIGVFLSAWVKMGLVLFYGVLCVVSKKVATAQEWAVAGKILQGILVVLVVYYAFVVANNLRIALWSASR